LQESEEQEMNLLRCALQRKEPTVEKLEFITMKAHSDIFVIVPHTISTLMFVCMADSS
jgi:hypothetical protein